jgi:hypothetical protein
VTAYGPLFCSAPTWASTNGDIAAGVGADLGLVLDTDQRWSLDAMFGEDEDGLPAVGEFCVVGPRQTTGKSAVLEVAAITDVTVFEVPLHVWTAHEFKTSRKAYLDMRRRILAHPDYAERATFRDSHGEEAIVFDNGCAIEFHARSGGSGRGFTTSRLTLDEWLYGQPADLGALVPTLVTIEDAQIRYGSSAGKSISGALRELRHRGQRGDSSLAYIEHGADRKPCALAERCTHEVGIEGCALDDVELWRQANPGFRNGRVSLAAMRRQRKALPPTEFMREFLSWWEEPTGEGSAFDPALWSSLIDTEPKMGMPVFGVATAPDRTWSAIVAAWRRPDGLIQLLLGDDYRRDAMWVPSRIEELRARWGGRVIADTASRGLISHAEEPSEGDQAKAHNGLADSLLIAGLRHGNEPALNTAVKAAQWRPYNNTRVLDRKGSTDISPLIAAALAVWGLGRNAAPWALYDD